MLTRLKPPCPRALLTKIRGNSRTVLIISVNALDIHQSVITPAERAHMATIGLFIVTLQVRQGPPRR